MHRITIDKEMTPRALEEKITVYIDELETNKYITLLRKTWPSTRITRGNKRYG